MYLVRNMAVVIFSFDVFKLLILLLSSVFVRFYFCSKGVEINFLPYQRTECRAVGIKQDLQLISNSIHNMEHNFKYLLIRSFCLD